ncbi:hypothetical protein T09_4470 [Trichinella sp. T9]|nr:hypothetical protein T09_4470 [Trichinella sp. T9]
MSLRAFIEHIYLPPLLYKNILIKTGVLEKQNFKTQDLNNLISNDSKLQLSEKRLAIQIYRVGFISSACSTN